MKRLRPALAAAVATALCSACAPLTERVILLPAGSDGRLGAVTVTAARGSVLLAEPYAQAEVLDGQPLRLRSDAASVQRDYAKLLSMQPPRPRRYVLSFVPGSDDTPTPESLAMLEQLVKTLAAMPGADLVVVGHTDRVGSLADNDRLSLQRAQAVRERLLAAGADPERITVAGRGERGPEIPTEDGVAEPRNHRVEITLR